MGFDFTPAETIKANKMKKLIYLLAIAFLTSTGSLSAQKHTEEYLGLPGDNLNLYAVMNLFQEAETLEAFERALNDPDNMINNLDLNGDNYVDYIMVMDYKEGNVHNIVLRVALNRTEYQDVAVFTVEKMRNGAVQVQLIGDVALYGRNYIIEPVYDETPNPGYRGNVTSVRKAPRNNVTVVRTTYYEVAHWPVIVYISQPTYVVYRSSWHYGYYPVYWHPWRAHYWHYYYGYHYNWHNHYYAYYRPSHVYRTNVYHTTYYTNIRHHSPTVVININKGNYRQTYNRPEKRGDGERRFAERHPDGRPASTRSRQDSYSNSRRNQQAAPERNESRRSAASQPTDSRRSSPEINRNEQQSGNSRRSASGGVETRSSGENNESGNSRRTTTAAPQGENRRSSEINDNSRRTVNSPERNTRGAEVKTQETENSRRSAPAPQRETRGSSEINRSGSNTAPSRQASPADNNRRSTERAAPVRSNNESSTAAPARRETTAPASESRRSESTAAPARENRRSESTAAPARETRRNQEATPAPAPRREASKTERSSSQSNEKSNEEQQQRRR
jgi:hypothetical protein